MYIDTAGHTGATQYNVVNTCLVEQLWHISGSRVVEMMGRLHVEFSWRTDSYTTALASRFGSCVARTPTC